MLRVLRRHSPRHVEVAHLDAANLAVWAERGFLRPTDLCAVPEVGTLTVAEMPTLSGALSRGARRDVTDLVVATGLAVAAGAAVKLGGTVGGIASLPLVAAAHVWMQQLRWRREVSLETLPTEPSALTVAETNARLGSSRLTAQRLAAVITIGLTALVPVGLFAKFGASAVAALGARRWLWRAAR